VPRIENIVQAAASIDHRIHLIIGGLHLVTANDADIARTVTSLHHTWKVDYIAPGHCTGAATFAALRKAFGDHYLYAGLGTRLIVVGVPTVAELWCQGRGQTHCHDMPAQACACGDRSVSDQALSVGA
jgi:Metal-dependent hydrolases of the beta-lactamase superfamily II